MRYPVSRVSGIIPSDLILYTRGFPFQESSVRGHPTTRFYTIFTSKTKKALTFFFGKNETKKDKWNLILWALSFNKIFIKHPQFSSTVLKVSKYRKQFMISSILPNVTG